MMIGALEVLKMARDPKNLSESDRESDVDEATGALEEQYERGYRLIPEDATEAEALLPHLPLESVPWG